MANELELLQYVKEVLAANPNIILKSGADEIKLAQRISTLYDFQDGQLFDKKTQQGTPHPANYVIFQTGKSAGMLEVQNLVPFNRKKTHGLTEPQRQRAQELTAKATEDFLAKNGYVFKDEKFGESETRRHIIGRISKTDNFIAESTPDGEGVQLRQIKNNYITLKAWPLKDIIDTLAKGMIDTRLTEIKNLEIEAGLREKAQKLAGNVYNDREKTLKPNTAKAEQLFHTLKGEHVAQRIQRRISVPNENELSQEFQNEFYYREGLLEGGLTLHDRRNLQKYIKDKIEDLNIPTIVNRESMQEYENRYRNYDNITNSY